ncbi:hypothetical protein L557_1167 [Bordetella pertussis STO1-CNMC-0004]|nr:hypothetical protein L557_1167 [Bordetella pertussis STO1-CNMC-0004]
MYAWFIRTGFEKLEIHRARCTHLQTQPGRIQPIDSSQLANALSRRIAVAMAVAQ